VPQHIGHATFLDINISLGSVVTQLRCRAIFNDNFIANLVQRATVQKIKIGQYLASYREEFGVLFF